MNSTAIMDLFEQLNREGLTLVIVTHDPKVANWASRRVHIVDGRLTDLTPGETRLSSSAVFDGEDRRAVSRSGITVRDMFTEAMASMLARPGRMLLTVLGVVIGLTALVAIIGLTRTAGGCIISQFDALAATDLFISARPEHTIGIVDPRSIAIFRATRNGVRPISGANNGAPAIAFGGPRSSRRALRAAPGLPQ